MATSARVFVEDTFQQAVASHLAGDSARAYELYSRTLHDNPRHAEALNNRATIDAEAGRRADARRDFMLAIDLQPNYGEALNNLGLLLAEDGEHAHAAELFALATQQTPNKASWFNNYGNTLVELFRFEEAVEAFTSAVDRDPAVADYWSNRGIAFRGLRDPGQARASLERALEIDPTHTNSLNNLGIVLKEAREYTAAANVFERAIALEPNNPVLRANLASVYERSGDHGALAAHALAAQAIDPNYPDSYNLLANAAMERGEYQRAEELYCEALKREPTNRNANWNLALIWLLHGDFARGWPQFEWRKRLQSVVIDRHDYGPNEWRGEDVTGKTVLLHAEQGIGDALQFVRYAKVIKDHGAAQVIVEAPHPVLSLVAMARGVDNVVARGAILPPYDLHASMMSLPWLFGTTLDTVPADIPYLSSEPRPVATRITRDGCSVGFVWAGNPEHARDRLRSAPLEEFLKLPRTAPITLYSLQKGVAAEAELQALGAETVINLAPDLKDFRDTAAAIMALDLVITVDTSVAHLSGALGKPTWLLLPHVPDFRWMLERTDSPWYPSMKLFRQPSPGDWSSVFSAVSAELATLSTTEHPAGNPLGDVVTVDSATKAANGTPRFDIWVPLAALADPALFAEYEAELTGTVAHASLRSFLEEALGSRDTLLDGDPGLGLVALDAARGPRAPSAIALVGGSDAQRVERIIGSRVPNSSCTRHPSVAAALAFTAARDTVARLRPHHDDEMADALARGISAPRVVCWDRVVPDRVTSFERLTALGYRHFTLSGAGPDLGLDPIASPGETQIVVSLSPASLAALLAQDGSQRNPGRIHIGMDWELRSDSGWGVYGTNLALELLKRSDAAPVVRSLGALELDPLRARMLERALPATGRDRVDVLLTALGNEVRGGTPWPTVKPKRRVGMIFFEDTHLDPTARLRANAFDAIVAGSSWNAQMLRAAGVENVAFVPQGIDPALFHPAPRAGVFADRFVIFSGGKLEYRKGQDIVVAAVRVFVARHPDALLVTAWHNAWPDLIADLSLAGYVTGTPTLTEKGLDISSWLAANGIPRGNHLDVGKQPNAAMAQIVREADVALFPNRAEGGTNLVAMECMASGIATVVSANTGHQDLVNTGGCLSLSRQQVPKTPTRFFRAIDGWGESDVEELVAVLEKLYADSSARHDIAGSGAHAMQDWTWDRQTALLLTTLAPLF